MRSAERSGYADGEHSGPEYMTDELRAVGISRWFPCAPTDLEKDF